MNEKYRPAGDIDPYWYVRVDGEWVMVDGTVETETPGGGRRIRFLFTDRPPTVADKGDLVMSRPPGHADSGQRGADGSHID